MRTNKRKKWWRFDASSCVCLGGPNTWKLEMARSISLARAREKHISSPTNKRQNSVTMMRRFLQFVLTALLLGCSEAQSYDYDQGGYEQGAYDSMDQDTLYHDYAARQQDKAAGAGYVSSSVATWKSVL